MNIDWNDEDVAPTWANYLAMDDDGEWYWYSLEPEWDEYYWAFTDGEYERAEIFEDFDGVAEQSLHYRYSYLRVSTPEEEKAVDDALGIELVSFRLPKDVIQKYQEKAKQTGLITKALMRAALVSFVGGEDE